jgi:hypothetical protein
MATSVLLSWLNVTFRIEFTTVEVGSYVIDVTVNGLTVPSSPLIAKAYDAGLIKVRKSIQTLY